MGKDDKRTVGTYTLIMSNLRKILNQVVLSSRSNGVYNQERLNIWSELLFRIICEYKEPSDLTMSDNIEQIVNRIQSCLEDPPSFVLGPYWDYAPICQSIALIKNKSDLWNLFTDLEHEKMTQIMKMFAYNWNLGCNTHNNYGTGVDLRGNYGKWRGPNYRLANIGLIFPLMNFFGGVDNLNELFLNYDYDTEMINLHRLRFTKALKTWTAHQTFVTSEGKRVLGAKDLTTYGGTAYILTNDDGIVNTFWRGEGKGVKIPYEFKDSYPYGIIHFLYNNCFDGGPCASEVPIQGVDFSAHIADGTKTPFEGEDGMMLEFNLANDGYTTRSSEFYCSIDFLLVVELAATLDCLKISKLQDYRNFKKVWTGMEDYIYKQEHGYNGYRLGHKDVSQSYEAPALTLWKTYWKNIYRPLIERNDIAK